VLDLLASWSSSSWDYSQRCRELLNQRTHLVQDTFPKLNVLNRPIPLVRPLVLPSGATDAESHLDKGAIMARVEGRDEQRRTLDKGTCDSGIFSRS
jgi:hypothetical protein